MSSVRRVAVRRRQRRSAVRSRRVVVADHVRRWAVPCAGTADPAGARSGNGPWSSRFLAGLRRRMPPTAATGAAGPGEIGHDRLAMAGQGHTRRRPRTVQERSTTRQPKRCDREIGEAPWGTRNRRGPCRAGAHDGPAWMTVRFSRTRGNFGQRGKATVRRQTACRHPRGRLVRAPAAIPCDCEQRRAQSRATKVEACDALGVA
jgi:hypothetical protein